MGRQVYHYGGTAKTLTPAQTAAVAYQVGWRGEDLVKAVAIAGRESSYRYNVHASDRPHSELSGDRGLFQINYVHDKNLIDAGIIRTRADLFDPVINAQAAMFLYKRSGNNFNAWTAGPGGWTAGGNPLYGTNVTKAREGVTEAANSGWLVGGVVPGWLDTLRKQLGSGPVTPGTPVGSGEGAGGYIPTPWGIIPNPVDGIGDAVGTVQSLAGAVAWLFNPRNWVRILQIVGGMVLLFVGITNLVGASGVQEQVIQLATGGKGDMVVDAAKAVA